MTIANWRRGDTHTLGVLLNGAEIPTVTAQGAPVIDDTFLILFNADAEAVVFTLPAVSFGRALGLSSSPTAPSRTRRAAACAGRSLSILAACRSRQSPCRWCPKGIRRPVARAARSLRPASLLGRVAVLPPGLFRCTYRLQLGPGPRLREARASSCPYLRDLGVSHLYLSPSLQAREGSTHGYDVVDPTRISEALGGEAAFRELCGEARATPAGRRARHRPEPHGGDGREPVLARPALAGAVLRPRLGAPARTGASSTSASSAGVRMEDPEVFEMTHAQVLELVADGLARRPPRRPSGRARRPAPLPRAAARGGRRARLGREDPRARRAAARLAGRGDDGLRVPERGLALFVDPPARSR